MEAVFRSRFLHFVVAIRDFSKDEPEDDELVAVSNTGGSFEFAGDLDELDDNGSCAPPLDFGFGSTERCGGG